MADALSTFQTRMLAILRGDPTLAAIVHATEDDVASRTALRAATGMSDGDIRLVDEVSSSVVTFVGLYLYDDDNANPDDDDIYIEPDVGTGAWVRYQDITALSWGTAQGTGGHVFLGIAPLLHGGRNLGRMPFLEVEVAGQEFGEISTSGGITGGELTLRAWYSNNVTDANADDCRSMIMRAYRAIRNARFNGNAALEPGQGGSYPRCYEDAKMNGVPRLTRIVGAVYGDVTVSVTWPYSESDLQ